MNRYRPEIDGLRALAVIPVVLFHAQVRGFSGGFVGVDVFFVISGYLITTIIRSDLDRGRFSFRRFWERRARRILPPLLAVTLFSAAAGWFVLLPPDYEGMSRSIASLSAFSSNVYFWRQSDYFSSAAETMPLLHTWSLAVEEQFYLLVPAFLVAISALSRRWSGWLLFCLAIASLLLSIYAVETATAPYCRSNCLQTAAFYLLPGRAWELACGALIAYVGTGTVQRTPKAIRELFTIGGLLLIALAVHVYDSGTPFPGLAALLPVAGAVLVIWANGATPTWSGTVLSYRPLVFVGLISYPLYLWHWPLLVFARYRDIDFSISPLATLVVVVMSLLLAFASWRVIELPIRQGRLLTGRQNLAIGAALGIAVVGAIGIAGTIGGGFPSRFDPEVLAYADGQFDYPVSHEACLRSTEQRIHSLDELCTLGQSEELQFLLWGDSHAGSLIPTFDSLAVRYGVSGAVVSSSACPPILEVMPETRPRCSEFNDAIYSSLNASQARTVVLVASWGGYEGNTVPSSTLASRLDAKMVQQFGVLAASLAATVDSLIEAGYEVWVVRDVPTYTFSIPHALAITSMSGGDVALVGLPYSELLTVTRNFDDLFTLLANKGIRTVDLPAILCDQTFCRTADNGASLYRDSNHLSNHGARFVEPAVEPFMRSLAGR